MHDVIVIGGGPSGLHTARRLSAEGLDVVLLERKSEIGKDIICTGIVGKDIFNRFVLPASSIQNEIQAVRMVSPFDTVIPYQHRESFACVVDREKFDRDLAALTRSNGAAIKTGHKVLDVSIEKSGVKIIAETRDNATRKFRSKIAILATGTDYRLNKKLGLGYPREFLNGIQTEVEVDENLPSTIFVGKDVAPGAFAWAIPASGNRVRVGLLTEKEPKTYFRNLIQKLFPDKTNSITNGRIQSKPIAHGLLSKTYGNRVLLVGEAAGQIKTTTGGGVYYGLLCSDIASDVVLQRFEDGTFSAKDFVEYEKRWKKALQKEIQVGYYARKVGAWMSDSQMESLFQIAKTDEILPLISEKGNFDWHSELILALLKKVPFYKLAEIATLRSQ